MAELFLQQCPPAAFCFCFQMSFPVREQSVLAVMGASLLTVLQEEASSCARPLL